MCPETARVSSSNGDEDSDLICDIDDDGPHEWHYDETDNITWKEGR